MTLPVEDIIPLIPQKPPFVMVSRLLSVSETGARSSFEIKNDNIFVKDGIFQEAGLLENIAQTAALKAGYQATTENKRVTSGYIGAVKDFEVFDLPKVGDELTTEVIVENQIFDVTVFSGKIWNNEILIARCEIKVFKGNQ